MNIPLRVAAVLACLMLVSAYSVTGLFARYTTSAQISDQARVAKFSIKGECALSQSITAELIPGGSQSITLVIKNDSEVAVEYTVEVSNVTKNLPLSFHMVKGTGSSAPDLRTNEGGATFTTQQLPGSHTDEYLLRIEWPPTAAGNEDSDLAVMGMVDYITVTVTAAQTD